jgi:hypothetical protein
MQKHCAWIDIEPAMEMCICLLVCRISREPMVETETPEGAAQELDEIRPL